MRLSLKKSYFQTAHGVNESQTPQQSVSVIMCILITSEARGHLHLLKSIKIENRDVVNEASQLSELCSIQ